MWHTDRGVLTRARADSGDIPLLNRLFSDAFTDRYRRDGQPGIRVPHLNVRIWEYALSDAGDGAMIWRDGRGDLVAFNMVHKSGSEGWMGPLAVRVDRQDAGIGRKIVQAGIDWLKDQGASTIGLETMPRTVDNIGFYSGFGFHPGHLTISLQATNRSSDSHGCVRLGRLEPHEREAALLACRSLSDAVAVGVDFTRELEITLALELGDAHLCYVGDRLMGYVLWHHAALAEGRPPEELRILKLVARDLATASRVIAAARALAAERKLPHVSIRCQSRAAELYDALIAERWQVQWTDLRMTLSGYPESELGGILISNWEI